MRILIEGYPYPYEVVKDLVPLDDVWGKVEKNVLMPYVGYFYNPRLADCVFVLPKVLLDANDMVFGKYAPEAIINFRENGTFKDSETSKAKDEEQLIYTLVCGYTEPSWYSRTTRTTTQASSMKRRWRMWDVANASRTTPSSTSCLPCCSLIVTTKISSCSF